MGFALWSRDGMAWAMGTHEYRPMGVAVISLSDHFSPRDFHSRRELPSRDRRDFLGFFASIAHLNQQLPRERRSQARRKSGNRKLSSGASII